MNKIFGYCFNSIENSNNLQMTVSIDGAGINATRSRVVSNTITEPTKESSSKEPSSKEFTGEKRNEVVIT